MMPVLSKNQILVDGGVVNPLPLSRVKRKKGDILIAVDLNYHCTKNSQKNEEKFEIKSLPLIIASLSYMVKRC